MKAAYKSQRNSKAERVNRLLMERVRASLPDTGADEDLCAAAVASVVHVVYQSRKAGLDVTPLDDLTGRRPNVARFYV